jgi:hypothetical protein
MKIVGSIVAFLVVIIFGAILNGYTLSILWAWFIANKFGLPELKIVEAIGLASTISFIMYSTDKDSEEEDIMEILARASFITLSKSAIFLSMGWVVTLFM